MTQELYIPKNFRPASLKRIAQAIRIIEEYEAEDLSLTLRQLYYQFVARGLMENKQRNYDNLGKLISDARLAGLINWESIEDRTRFVRALPHWETGAQAINMIANRFRLDKWLDQEFLVEVWIEKDALVGVIEDVCCRLDVPYFACRGYTSQSEQWRAGKRFEEAIAGGRQPVVIHLGDHDPSGIDMTRDNFKRLSMFAGREVTVERIALNWDQVEEYDPPPNPAKMTDSRYEGYRSAYGDDSWELDALDPRVIQQLIVEHVEAHMDPLAWQRSVEMEQDIRHELQEAAGDFEERGV